MRYLGESPVFTYQIGRPDPVGVYIHVEVFVLFDYRDPFPELCVVGEFAACEIEIILHFSELLPSVLPNS